MIIFIISDRAAGKAVDIRSQLPKIVRHLATAFILIRKISAPHPTETGPLFPLNAQNEQDPPGSHQSFYSLTVIIEEEDHKASPFIKKMPITIIQPSLPKAKSISATAPTPSNLKSESEAESGSDDGSEDTSDSEAGGVDLEGDIAMQIKKESRRPAKRARTAQQGHGQGPNSDIVTPGEVITDDPQWMRYVNTLSILYLPFSRFHSHFNTYQY